MLAKRLALLPIVIFLIVAIQHFVLVNTQHLSPWLGGGFGMFASTDVSTSRQLIVTVINQKGDEYPVALEGHLIELQKRARGLPNETQLNLLAQATWLELKTQTPVDNSPLIALRIEVWKIIYDADSLQPQLLQIALKHFDFEY